ncbi:UNVERIFIED_CONTAM: Zinc finger MYND domain-containing protein 10 [Siphonaria sp. JEL0065]|nr:Zinc finger MYND domain-containing protein 10 [Siphonaria sp. JEL0065]
MSTPISAFEADLFVSQLATKSITLDLIATERWYKNHETLEHLNIQAHMNVQSQCEEYVTESFITHGKIEYLIKDLLTIDAWKSKVFPKVVDVAATHSIKSYLILYHEATLVNLLEIIFFNKDAVLQAGDLLIDLVDYCSRKMAYLNTWTAPESTPPLDQTDRESLLKNHGDLSFAIAINCLSIFRYITDQCGDVSLAVLTRMLNFNDMVCSCVHLIEQAPWIQKKLSQGKGQVAAKFLNFENGNWKEIDEQEYQRLGKVEAQVWLSLYNLLLDNECRRKFVFSDSKKSVILRVEFSLLSFPSFATKRWKPTTQLRPYIEEILVDQLPILCHLQRYLDELLIMDVPHNAPTSESFIIEQVPEATSHITSKLNIKHLTTRFETLIKDESAGTSSMAIAKSMAAMYDLDNLDSLLEDPKCGKCGKPAENRCSKCKSEWYCGRKCQVESWKKHKAICEVLQQAASHKETQQKEQIRGGGALIEEIV